MKKKYKVLTIYVLVGGMALFLYWVVNNQWGREGGPEAFIIDKQVCQFCGMHIGDIRYAAQIQTESKTLFYDDVGCLIHDREKLEEEVQAVFYYHFFEDRWIPEDDVVFIKVSQSPMGHGLGSISKDDPESVASYNDRMDLTQAKIYILNKPFSRESDKMKMH